MNIQKLFENNDPLATSGLAYLTCCMRLFSGCTGREETVRAREIDLNRGFAPWSFKPGAPRPPEQHQHKAPEKI